MTSFNERSELILTAMGPGKLPMPCRQLRCRALKIQLPKLEYYFWLGAIYQIGDVSRLTGKPLFLLVIKLAGQVSTPLKH